MWTWRFLPRWWTMAMVMRNYGKGDEIPLIHCIALSNSIWIYLMINLNYWVVLLIFQFNLECFDSLLFESMSFALLLISHWCMAWCMLRSWEFIYLIYGLHLDWYQKITLSIQLRQIRDLANQADDLMCILSS